MFVRIGKLVFEKVTMNVYQNYIFWSYINMK